MRRSMLARSLAVLCVTFAASAGRGDDGGVGLSAGAPVAALIATLDNPDASLRTAATQRLIDAGTSARPELRRVLAAADPETARRISFILMHIQWVYDDDSDLVKQALVGYADADADDRRALADRLSSPDPGAKGPLLRILLHDTCSAVRWEAAAALSHLLDEDNDPIARQLDAELADHPAITDAYPLPSENAALLALAGWACRETRPGRAQELMNRAVAIESANPSAYLGQMDFVFHALCDTAVSNHEYVRASELLRDQAARGPWVEDALSQPISDLFALHAEYGPFPGLADDIRNYRACFVRPEMIYTLGRWMDRHHHPLAAGLVNGAAFAASGASLQSHFSAGAFLLDHDWYDTAGRELKICLTLPGGQSFAVYYALSRLAGDRDDELGAATNLEAGLRRLPPDLGQQFVSRDGKVSAWTPNDGWAQVQWHYLRAAREAHDTAAAKLHLDKLLDLDQNFHVLQKDTGMAADIVPELQDLGRGGDADRIFAAAYNALAAQITAAPTKPMPKNNLAWLCVCSNRHLDEALRVSTEAVTMDPMDPACLDTQAEAYFRTGNLARAIEVETRALRVKPDDVYMQKQVKKYQAAADAVVPKGRG